MPKKARAATELTVASPIAELPGVGRKRAAVLERQGIDVAGRLVSFWPSRHRNIPPRTSIAAVEPGAYATIAGVVRSSRRIRSRRSPSGHLRVVVDDGSASMRIVLFNQGFLESTLTIGSRHWFSGRVASSGDEPFAVVDHGNWNGEDLPGHLRPIYPHVPELKAGVLANLIADVVERLAPTIDDPLGEEFVRSRGLPTLREAIRSLHLPRSEQQALAAERRLIYDGFLAAALDVESSSEMLRGRAQDAPAFPIDDATTAELLGGFPYELTTAQRAAVDVIRDDLSRTRPMRRLLQGDVGCGKTTVAAFAALTVARFGHQAAIMVPTEALARQFHGVLDRYARRLGLAAVLLCGSLPESRKAEGRRAIASGEVRLVVGTHALIQEDVAFAKLGLVVVDEQHKFGVRQRLELVQKGTSPHLLVMSATPIPRTLAMTVHGDLDCTEIRGLPPGRGSIVTTIAIDSPEEPYDWSWIADAARSGEPVFVVFPSIDEPEEELELSAARPALLGAGREIYRRFFRGIPAKGLHGRMDEQEKDAALEGFRTGAARLLFATTVVEVGVDVPEATIMVVVGAQHFGLSQLHQLRGRVGRGRRDGRCVLLVSSAKAATSARLGVLSRTRDGFEIAEHDLEIRGPGDMMGLRQHGPAITAAAAGDLDVLHAAFEDARRLVDAGADPGALASELLRWSRSRPLRHATLTDSG